MKPLGTNRERDREAEQAEHEAQVSSVVIVGHADTANLTRSWRHARLAVLDPHVAREREATGRTERAGEERGQQCDAQQPGRLALARRWRCAERGHDRNTISVVLDSGDGFVSSASAPWTWMMVCL